MRKILVGVLFAVLMAGALCAETPTEEDYQNLQELRTKLRRMKQEMDAFMKDIIATYPEDAGRSAADVFGQDIKVDVSETAKAIIVRADLPGMEKDRIDITLENERRLKIAGTREISKKEATPGVVRQERMSGRFERILELPSDCMNDGIEATYANGVLEMVIPKKTVAKTQEVKIKVQ